MPLIYKRTISIKANPQKESFARVSLVFKDLDHVIEEGEFRFIIASAVQDIHGDIANEPLLLQLKSLDKLNYQAIIKFKTTHHVRVVTSLLLFGQWKGADCRFNIERVSQSPCFLAA